ncbi:MAG: hypothetical protein ACLRFE_03455, partial [Clostridia bacterium]
MKNTNNIIKTQYVIKKDTIDGNRIVIKQNFDEHGGYFYRVETNNMKSMGNGNKIIAECYYTENHETSFNRERSINHNPTRIRAIMQIRFIDKHSNVYRTFQLNGLTGFKDGNLIKLEGRKFTHIKELNDYEFLQSLYFIKQNFDKF